MIIDALPLHCEPIPVTVSVPLPTALFPMVVPPEVLTTAPLETVAVPVPIPPRMNPALLVSDEPTPLTSRFPVEPPELASSRTPEVLLTVPPLMTFNEPLP